MSLIVILSSVPLFFTLNKSTPPLSSISKEVVPTEVLMPFICSFAPTVVAPIPPPIKRPVEFSFKSTFESANPFIVNL